MPKVPTYTAEGGAAPAQLERFPRVLYAPEPVADPGRAVARLGETGKPVLLGRRHDDHTTWDEIAS